jgi:lysophospholipase L1-like esterase
VLQKKIKENLIVEVRNFKTMALLSMVEINDSWVGGTFIGRYAFSYGGGTAPAIHSFDVSIINNPSVCFVGDSITEGYGPSVPSKSFAHILRDMDDNSVISAESGNTVNDVMGRFATEFERIKPKIIFMLIGANNTSVPSNLFDAMLTACDNIGAKLVLNYIPTGHYVSDINALIDTKNKIGVHFEEISMDSQGNIDTSLFPDSLHPNDEGSKKMAERSVVECPAVFNAS